MPRRRTATLVVLGLLATSLATVLATPPAWAAGTVTVRVVDGQGSVTGEGISCTHSGGPDCSERHADTVEQECDPELKPPCWDVSTPPSTTLTAGADTNGFVFDGWTGCESPSGRVCSLTVVRDTVVTARFRDDQPPNVSRPTPSSGVHRGSIVLSVVAGDNSGAVSRVEFRVGGQQLSPDFSPPYSLEFDTRSVPDGTATVRATAFDHAGLSSFAEGSLMVDNTAPVLTVTGPDGVTVGPGALLEWGIAASDTTSGLASIRCSVHPAGTSPTFGACSRGAGGHAVSGLPGGVYELVVQATDGGGLTTTAARTVTVDDTAPQTDITSGPAPGSRLRTRSVELGFAASEPGSTFTCGIAPEGVTGTLGPCSAAASHSVTLGADGTYVFTVSATDPHGNVDASPAARTFSIDTVAPQTSIPRGPQPVVRVAGRTALVAFRLAAGETGGTFQCRLDRQRWRACSSRPSYRVPLGSHTLVVAAVDRAGNVDRTPAVRRWRVVRR